MKILYDLLQTLILALFLASTCYNLILTFFSVVRKVNGGKKDYRSVTKFALIIPAHNEEVVIGKTLDNVKNVQYPRELVDFIVVADNCTDHTAQIAHEKGVAIYERFDAKHRGKGYALAWIFSKLLRSSPRYDAFVVIDADSYLSPNFLLAMNKLLCDGHLVIQGYYTVLNVTESWRTSLMFASYALIHYIRPKGKNALGLSTPLKGNGMCFSRKVLEDVKWDCYSIVEDFEYYIKLRLNAIQVKFAPAAVVYSQMPTSSKQGRSQRIRWESGTFDMVRRFFFRVVLYGIQTRRFLAFLDAFEMLTPPLTVVFGTSLFFFVISILRLYLLGFRDSELYFTAWFLVVAGQVVYLISGLILTNAPLKVYLSLLYVPIYMAWKIWIYFLILIGVNKGMWIRTSRRHI